MFRPCLTRLGSFSSSVTLSRPLSTSKVNSFKVTGPATARLSLHKLDLPDGRFVRYRQVPGELKPSIVYVPGLHSYAHMDGMMSQCILRFCDFNHYRCVAYDHECMGKSEEGSDRKKVLFSHWIEDVTTVVDKLIDGPVVLVSCSMGGWLSLMAALRMPEKIFGLVLYAPAVNYVRPYYQKHVEMLPPEIKERLDKGEFHVMNREYGDALLKKDFAEDSLQYEIDFDSDEKINLKCPIRIIHGLQDTEVLPETSMKLTKKFRTNDVDLIYRKHSKHQAEQPFEIELVINTIDRMLKDNPIKNQTEPTDFNSGSIF